MSATNSLNTKDGRKDLNIKDGKKKNLNAKDEKEEEFSEEDWSWIDPNQRRIYIGGVPAGMSSKAVFEFFTKFGPVEFARVHDGRNGNYRFAFVTFEFKESWQAALGADEAALTLKNGRKLRVGAARDISQEGRGWTWVRTKRFVKPWYSKGSEGTSIGNPGSSASEVQSGEGVGQHHLPPSDLQYSPPLPQADMSPMVSYSHYLSSDSNESEEQMMYNNYLGDQQVFSPLANNNNDIYYYYNYYVTDPVMFSPPLYSYNYPIAGMVFPQYQHQFPQCEVEDPGNF